MRYLYSLLTTAAVLAVALVAYVLTCRLMGDRPTVPGFTLILVVNLMYQSIAHEFEKTDKDI